VEIRELRADEGKAAFYLCSQAFMDGSRDMSRMEDPDELPHATFGVWDEAGLQAMVTIIQYHIHLGPESTVPMGGVAGVACLPASRGKGYAGLCLKYSLERMRDAGQFVSVLFPFSFDYYERLGWVWAGATRTYEVPTRILRPAPETEDVRAATEADRPALAAAYMQFAGSYRGAVQREEKLWNKVLNSTKDHYRYTYLYETEGRVEGYLTYKGGTRQETRLREFVTLTPRAGRALLGLLRRHEMQIDKLIWEAPPDDLLWSALYHWNLKTTIEPAAMVRIVDLPRALSTWRPRSDASGSVVLAVRDEAAPWNTGTWRVEFAMGDVTVAPTDVPPQVELDIQALSQAYFGTPTVAEIRAADRMTVHDEAGYQAMRDLFAGPPMWMSDSF
jgi:predicted acetyltransferase